MNDDILTELKKLETTNEEGLTLLRPADVWEFGRSNRDSAIAHWLEAKGAFDPEKAQEQYGLLLARQLIVRVKVTIPVPDARLIKVRAYQSLSDQRGIGGGYEQTRAILTNRDRTQQLILTALAELQAVRKRYETIAQLGRVFHAIDELKRDMEIAS